MRVGSAHTWETEAFATAVGCSEDGPHAPNARQANNSSHFTGRKQEFLARSHSRVGRSQIPPIILFSDIMFLIMTVQAKPLQVLETNTLPLPATPRSTAPLASWREVFTLPAGMGEGEENPLSLVVIF